MAAEAYDEREPPAATVVAAKANEAEPPNSKAMLAVRARLQEHYTQPTQRYAQETLDDISDDNHPPGCDVKAANSTIYGRISLIFFLFSSI